VDGFYDNFCYFVLVICYLNLEGKVKLTY
jgi:hypothetical protein